MERFYKMVETSNKRFPEGVKPFQMATGRLLGNGTVKQTTADWKTRPPHCFIAENV